MFRLIILSPRELVDIRFADIITDIGLQQIMYIKEIYNITISIKIQYRLRSSSAVWPTVGNPKVIIKNEKGRCICLVILFFSLYHTV